MTMIRSNLPLMFAGLSGYVWAFLVTDLSEGEMLNFWAELVVALALLAVAKYLLVKQ